MNQPSRSAERINVREEHAAHLGLAARSQEQARFRGVFDWRMTIPRPHHLDGYIDLRDRIAETERLPVALRVPYLPRLAQMKEMLAQFPQEEQWRDSNHNLVVTVGGNDLLDKYLAGSAYTAAFYLGLISLTGYAAGVVLADTMASHAGWTEDQNYSNSTRIAAVWSAAASKSKALSAALVYNINATTTLKGSFLTTVSTKGGTTGILVTGGLFTGGDQGAQNGNTLSASYSLAV